MQAVGRYRILAYHCNAILPRSTGGMIRSRRNAVPHGGTSLLY